MTPRSLFTSALDAPKYMSKDEAQALTKKVLSYVTAANAARISVGSGNLANSRFAVNQISTAGDSFQTQVSVRATVGKRSATASGNRLDDDSLKALVQKAEALAKLSPEDPETLPELGPQTYRPDLGPIQRRHSIRKDARRPFNRLPARPKRTDLFQLDISKSLPVPTPLPPVLGCSRGVATLPPH